MLADALGILARDIYHDDTFTRFDLTNHPWYRDTDTWNLTENCVIKSHERAGTTLHNFPAHTLHLVRDGRDVVVSRFFFAKDFCVKNGITESFTQTFEEFLEQTAREWAEYVTGWSKADVLQVRYEELLADTAGQLRRILDSFGLDASDEQIAAAIQANTKEKFREKLSKAFEHNTFVRKGVAGDWLNHFTQEHKETFNRIAGQALTQLGYEPDGSWCAPHGLMGKLKSLLGRRTA
jgi:hypothetical protein